MQDILKGKLVRLSAIDPEEFAKATARWRRDSEYDRLLAADAAMLGSAQTIQRAVEKELETESDESSFAIRAIADDKLLGGVHLEALNWSSRDSFVGIYIGEREDWGKGFGTEAMSLLLRYAFLEVNLRRVSLSVFEYNPRAIRSYEKVGFRHEGRQRQFLNRDGRRWDMLFMGILRDEWRLSLHAADVN